MRERVRLNPNPERQFHYTGKRGRPAWEPEDWQRKMAMELAGLGLPRPDIAKILEISPVTLDKNLTHELELGRAQFHAVAAKRLYKHILDGNFAALQFYMRVQMGWVEPKPEIPGSDDDDPIAGLSDAQLEQEIASLATRERSVAQARGLEAPMSE